MEHRGCIKSDTGVIANLVNDRRRPMIRITRPFKKHRGLDFHRRQLIQLDYTIFIAIG